MSQQDPQSHSPILVGSIIHLENHAPGGGYLDARGWVTEDNKLSNFYDPRVRAFVTTHQQSDRLSGSGSWKVISADAAAEGHQVTVGDRIHLLNMHTGVGYLDSFEWVWKLTPFATYPMTIGVFTSSVPNRGGGLSGTWTIHAQNPDGSTKAIGTAINGGDAIYFKNEYAGAGVLSTHGRVADHKWLNNPPQTLSENHPLFTVADNQQYFVFTNPLPNGSNPSSTSSDKNLGSHLWSVTVSVLSQPVGQGRIGSAALLRGQASKIEGIKHVTSKLQAIYFEDFSGKTLEAALQAADGQTSTNQEEHKVYRKTVLDYVKSGKNSDVLKTIDYDFSVEQRLNIHALSQTLDDFYQCTLQELMLQSLEKHQRDKTIAPLGLFRQCARHVVTDYEIIQQAIIQRRWHVYPGDSHEIGDTALELLIMDKLAIKSLLPFQGLLTEHPEKISIITYLSENTHIHHVPYTKEFILIGVSYDRLPLQADLLGVDGFGVDNFENFELMAIPHEVGHYVYRHARLENGETFEEVSEQFRGTPYFRWCAEIFADTYGCLVAGPLSAFGMQRLLMSIDRERVWKDDEDHPTPVLRVFILAEILHVLDELEASDQISNTGGKRLYNFLDATQKLNHEWTAILQRWGYERMADGEGRPARLYVPDDSTIYLEKLVSIDRVIKLVRPIIVEFAMQLRKILDSYLVPWCRGDYDDLADYDKQLKNMTSESVAHGQVAPQLLPKRVAEPAGLAMSLPDGLTLDGRLQYLLDNWDHDGPTGFGAH